MDGNPKGNFDTSMVGPLGGLFALLRRQIGQVSSKLVLFVVRSSTIPFLDIRFILKIETRPSADDSL